MCFGSVWLFPLKDCQSRINDILFIIDCRSELNAQIEFIQTATDYIFKERRGEKNQTFMTFSTTGLFETNELKDIQDTLMTCDQSFPISDVFNVSRIWFTSRRRPLVVMILISTSLTDYFNDLGNILETQNRDTNVDRFFVLSTGEENLQRSDLNFIHVSPTFHDVNIVQVFAEICESGCLKSITTFTTGSAMTSYYHITDDFTMSHDQSVQYCAKQANSYLISIESSKEMYYLINLVNEFIKGKDLKIKRLPVGIKKIITELFWHSHNPFLFFNDIYYAIADRCTFFNFSSLSNDELIEMNIENIMDYVFTDNCSEEVSPSLVICECHEFINNPDLTKELLSSVNLDSNIVENTYYEYLIFFIFFVNDVAKHRFLDISNIMRRNECVKGFSSHHDYFKYYACSEKFHDNFIQKESSFSILQATKYNHFILQRFNISDCTNSSRGQQSKNLSSFFELNINEQFDLICPTETNKTDFLFPSFQCHLEPKKLVHRCIKSKYYNNSNCQDNSHLQNCENFICPKGLIKCPNSYCIYITYLADGIRDCPFGEDEFMLKDFVGTATVSFKVEESCIDPLIDINYEILSYFDKDVTFLCHPPCPINYVCVSNRVKKNETDNIEFFLTTKLPLHNYSKLFFPTKLMMSMSPIFHIVAFYGTFCKISNYDYSFQYWKFSKLILLDLSHNELIGSNDLRLVQALSNLKVLNFSHNENLTIDQNFVFPTSLEIIDLSYTKISLKFNVFENVTFLKHLNLSNTLVSTFQDMGIPEYFTLESLYIENVEMRNIKENFFRGLTINSELRASDYKLCCPQILNPNISVDKCHAPLDVISSCKHLVGDILKRITIWTVGLITVVGNGIVLVYRIGWNREIFKKAYGLFVSGLAVSDFIMGVYLLLIAAVDIQYKDIYVLEDVKWRHSVLCQFAGFLSTISSETSTFFICLITIDRFLTITFPFGQHKFTKTGKIFSFTLVWFFGFLLALIPITSTELNIYSSNGLCLALPLGSSEHNGWVFSFIVFVVFNFILFLFIAFGQIFIFVNIVSIRKNVKNIQINCSRRNNDLKIATKLAFVALTDFMCWFPVGILGFLSLNGHTFDREVYAWIAVFVMPINSALNPIIYTVPIIIQKCLMQIRL